MSSRAGVGYSLNSNSMEASVAAAETALAGAGTRLPDVALLFHTFLHDPLQFHAGVRSVLGTGVRLLEGFAGGLITRDYLGSEGLASTGDRPDNLPALEQNERAHILRALEKSDGVVRGDGGAARFWACPSPGSATASRNSGSPRRRPQGGNDGPTTTLVIVVGIAGVRRRQRDGSRSDVVLDDHAGRLRG